MRFVWYMQKPEPEADKGKDKPLGGAQAADIAPGRVKPGEIGADLKDYIESTEKVDQKAKDEFAKKAMDWEKSENIDEIRRAGVTAAENEKDPMKKHRMLSALFLERDKKPGAKMSFKVDFKGNDLAERKVGAGDLLPISAKAIRVQYADGRIVERAIRAINPSTGRIGYYDADALQQGAYRYVPVFSGTTIDVLETQASDSLEVKRRMFAENMEIYNPPKRVAPASAPSSYMYSGAPRPFPSGSFSGPRRFGPQPGISSMPPNAGYATIEGKRFDAIDRRFWETVGARLITCEPDGSPLTFMGRKIPSINALIYPYLKEAEARMKEKGCQYTPGGIECYCPRNIAGTNTASYHTWAVALDFDPAHNPQYKQWNELNPEKRVPMEFVEIMESLGFEWGGRWSGKPDAMHFQFTRINPLTSTALLRSPEGQKYKTALIDPAMNAPGTKAYAARTPMEAPNGVALSKTKDYQQIASDHRTNFEKMEIRPEEQKRLKAFRERVMQNRARYEAVAQATGIPWALIAAIHERESGGRFNTYLHNGDPLGKPTTHHPAGKLFYDWETAAIDALNSIQLRGKLGINADTKDMGALLTYAEQYNGLGYRNKGYVSPYVYAGTNIYQGGKVTRDFGPYEPNVWDRQLGVAEMLIALSDPEDYLPQKKNMAYA